YIEVARRAQTDWNANGNAGLVVGATYPDQLRMVRELCPELPILVPGVGAQGGDPMLAVRAAVDRQGERAIVSASRSILFAADGDDFAEAARRETLRLREELNAALT
ncbi:MAG TPA: orotidine 5'-phosphate decarboxylase / HUMPS family protein, partial [Roseiflexaceae bacterium]|nr:orotidine 5'-phosphate decarboxylase / HUMPS family protein [Roseiflexaceae bacterium]